MTEIHERNRKQMRGIMFVGTTRPDGSKYTDPSYDARRQKNRAAKKVAKAARKRNRRA